MLEYFKTTYDKDGMFLTNKKVSKIRKSTFEQETQTGEYEKQTYKTNQWVKETKRKRIEIEAIIKRLTMTNNQNSHPTITHLSKLLTDSIRSITPMKSIRSCSQDEINSIKNHFFNSLHAQAIIITDSIVDKANYQYPESPLSDYLLDYKHLILV